MMCDNSFHGFKIASSISFAFDSLRSGRVGLSSVELPTLIENLLQSSRVLYRLSSQHTFYHCLLQAPSFAFLPSASGFFDF